MTQLAEGLSAKQAEYLVAELGKEFKQHSFCCIYQTDYHVDVYLESSANNNEELEDILMEVYIIMEGK